MAGEFRGGGGGRGAFEAAWPGQSEEPGQSKRLEQITALRFNYSLAAVCFYSPGLSPRRLPGSPTWKHIKPLPPPNPTPHLQHFFLSVSLAPSLPPSLPPSDTRGVDCLSSLVSFRPKSLHRGEMFPLFSATAAQADAGHACAADAQLPDKRAVRFASSLSARAQHGECAASTGTQSGQAVMSGTVRARRGERGGGGCFLSLLSSAETC